MNSFDIIDEFGYKSDYSYLNEVLNHTLKKLNINNACFSIIFIDDEKIILKKYEPADIFTGSMDDLIEYQGKKVSKESILEMARIANLKISE